MGSKMDGVKQMLKKIADMRMLFSNPKPSKTEHVSNYLVLIALEDDSYPTSYTLPVFKLQKLMYLIEAASYVRVGYGMTEEKFYASRCGYGINPVGSYRQYYSIGNHDILTGYMRFAYEEAGLNDCLPQLLPSFLLSEEEKEIVRIIWNEVKPLSAWEIIEWMKKLEAYQKATVEDSRMLKPEDIRKSLQKPTLNNAVTY